MAEAEVPSVRPTSDLFGAFEKITRISRLPMFVRRFLVLEVHLALWAGALWLALKLRFDGNVPAEYELALPVAASILVASRALAFYLLGLFHGLWRYAGVSE